MAVSEQMLAMVLALHVPVGHDAARTLGPEALAQPSGGVVLADNATANGIHLKSAATNGVHLKEGTITQRKAGKGQQEYLENSPIKGQGAQGLGDIKGESQDDNHKDPIELQHGQGDQKDDGVQPLDRNTTGQ